MKGVSSACSIIRKILSAVFVFSPQYRRSSRHSGCITSTRFFTPFFLALTYARPLARSARPEARLGKLLSDTATVTALFDRLLHRAHVLTCGPRNWRTELHPATDASAATARHPRRGASVWWPVLQSRSVDGFAVSTEGTPSSCTAPTHTGFTFKSGRTRSAGPAGPIGPAGPAGIRGQPAVRGPLGHRVPKELPVSLGRVASRSC